MVGFRLFHAFEFVAAGVAAMVADDDREVLAGPRGMGRGMPAATFWAADGLVHDRPATVWNGGHDDGRVGVLQVGLVASFRILALKTETIRAVIAKPRAKLREPTAIARCSEHAGVRASAKRAFGADLVGLVNNGRGSSTRGAKSLEQRAWSKELGAKSLEQGAWSKE